MCELLNVLREAPQGNDQHPLWEYETTRHPQPESTGIDGLRFLMQGHGLRLGDLPEIGSQDVVS